MGLLDMQDLIGAATVMGTLIYGARMVRPDVPISICIIKTSVTSLRMMLNQTVDCLDRISLCLLLLKFFRTMLPTFTASYRS